MCKFLGEKMKINFAVLPAVVAEIIGIPQVRVVWIGEIAESVFFILVGLGLFGVHFFPFLSFRFVLLYSFRLLLVDRGGVDVPRLFHVPVFLQVDGSWVVDRFLRLQMHIVVSGVVFSVSVSVDKQAGVVFSGEQVEQLGAVVFHRSPQHDFLRSVEKLYNG